MRFRHGAYVVIGAASGIGRALAETLADAGLELMLVDRDEEGLERVVNAVAAQGSAVGQRTLDVTDYDALRDVAADLLERGPVAGLINGAGVLQLGTIEDVSEDDWDRVVGINLKGAYLSSRAFIPVLRANGGGAVVNLASISGRTKSTWSAPNYVASKAGVIGLTMVLAAQHAADGIRVNCVAPGTVETPMIADYTEGQREVMRSTIPMGRFAESSEVATAAAFLLSEEASYITGQTLNVNGGQFMT